MKRRQFITLLGGTAAALPLTARAQQAERMRRVGILFGGFSETDPEPQARVEAFQHLRELGWTDGRNIQIDLRIGAGNATRIQTYADELISSMPDVLVSNSTPAAVALARRTKTLPIVFVNFFDPVGSGFVTSLARPGGNITGFSSFEPAMTGKWLELLKEIAPEINRVLFVFDRGNETFGNYFRAAQTLAPKLQLQIVSAAVANAADIEQAVNSFVRGGQGVGMTAIGTVASANRALLIALAGRHRLPTVYTFAYFVRMGGLMSYGVDSIDLWRRAASYADRIFKGAKPADLPVQAPTKFELVINLKTAKALGLTVPPTLIARADEVTE